MFVKAGLKFSLLEQISKPLPSALRLLWCRTRFVLHFHIKGFSKMFFTLICELYINYKLCVIRLQNYIYFILGLIGLLQNINSNIIEKVYLRWNYWSYVYLLDIQYNRYSRNCKRIVANYTMCLIVASQTK